MTHLSPAEVDPGRTVVNGTSYDRRAPAGLVVAIERLLAGRQPVHVHYGDPETGKDDGAPGNEEVGRIGRSTGTEKIPLLVPIGAVGGPALLEQCVVKVRTADGRNRTLYRHPLYSGPDEVAPPPGFSLSDAFHDLLAYVANPTAFEGLTGPQLRHYMRRVADMASGPGEDGDAEWMFLKKFGFDPKPKERE